MHIELPHLHWDLLNHQLRSIFGIEENQNIRAYGSFPHAVYEAIHATTQFFPHKKGLFYLKHQSPLLTPFMAPYLKEGYQVVSPTLQELESLLSQQGFEAWFQTLPKDLLIAVFACDHPVTGEYFALTHELEKRFNEKKVLCVVLSHYHHIETRTGKEKEVDVLLPFTQRICALSDDAAVTLLGSRVRGPALFAQFCNLDAGLILNVSKMRHRNPQMELIQKFESSLSNIAEPYFSAEVPRSQTRAVIALLDVSGDAVMGELPQYAHGLATPHACAFESYGLFRDWWKPEPDLNRLARTLFVDVQILQEPQFAIDFVSAVERIRSQQEWKIPEEK